MPDRDKLDDLTYMAFTSTQVADMLGVEEALLRSLDTAGLVRPHRSDDGHCRYTCRQLTLISRLRAQLDKGRTLAAASCIIGLQDRLARAEIIINDLREQLD